MDSSVAFTTADPRGLAAASAAASGSRSRGGEIQGLPVDHAAVAECLVRGVAPAAIVQPPGQAAVEGDEAGPAVALAELRDGVLSAGHHAEELRPLVVERVDLAGRDLAAAEACVEDVASHDDVGV